MDLFFNQLIPIPLRDRINNSGSQIWNQNVRFTAGDKIFVHAPSGTGKTTFINILYGIRRDYTGNVSWGTQNLNNATNDQLAELRQKTVSIVFQDLRLFPELTAFENIEVKRVLTNLVKPDTVSNWLHQLGIGDKAGAKANTLSYGEQQRVAIIRALTQPFKWLLMDEPFSHLDKANAQKAADLINSIVRERSAGIVLADLDEDIFLRCQKNFLL